MKTQSLKFFTPKDVKTYIVSSDGCASALIVRHFLRICLNIAILCKCLDQSRWSTLVVSYPPESLDGRTATQLPIIPRLQGMC